MNPRIRTAKPLENFLLDIEFKNGEKGIFDVKPYFEYSIYEPLMNFNFFKNVTVFCGAITWNDALDFCPDTVYLESKKLVLDA
jgi:Protein of unknown function (DUF2442)